MLLSLGLLFLASCLADQYELRGGPLVDSELNIEGVTKSSSNFDHLESTSVFNESSTSVFNAPPDGEYNVILDQTLEMREIRHLLEQLDDVILEAQEVSRTRRDSPFGPPTTCSVSEEELNALLALLTNTTRSMTSAVGTDNVNLLQIPRCSQLLHIKNSINTLLIKFNALMKNQDIGADYLVQKRVYEDDIRDLKKQMDDLERDNKQEHKAYTDQMLTIFQELKSKMNAALTKYEDEKKKHRETKIKNCILKVTSGEYESALESFKELNDDQLLDRIIKTVYGKDTFSNVNKISKLLNTGLPYSLTTTGYKILYQEMKSSNQLDILPVLQVYYDVTFYLNQTLTNGLSYSANFSWLNSSLTPHVQNVINSFSIKVRNRDFDQILQYARSQITVMAVHIPSLVKFSFNCQVQNYVNVQDIIDKLYHLNHVCIGYTALFDEMERCSLFNTNEIIRLGIHIRRHLDANKEKYLNYAFCGISSIKNRFPTSVRNIVWSDRVSIYNTFHGEYFYADVDDRAKDDNRRSVYTWMPFGAASYYMWRLEYLEGGKYFYIKNDATDECLYAEIDSRAYSDSRRSVYTWRTKNIAIFPGGKWYLEPVDDGVNVVIKNKHYKEYLFADTNARRGFLNLASDDERRTVYTQRTEELVFDGWFAIYDES